MVEVSDLFEPLFELALAVREANEPFFKHMIQV